MEGTAGGEQHEALVDSFRGITSSSREEALFFLESHNWLLDSAIQSFFDANSISDQEQEPQESREEPSLLAAPPPRSSAIPSPFPSSIPPAAAAMNSSKDKKKASKPSGSRPGIRTLADLNRRSDPGSDSDDDGPQEYYAGGEKSGMLVQDPSKGGHDVDAIFDQAKQMGAVQGPFEHHSSSSSRSFTGTGRLLSGETVPSAPRQPENVIYNIYFWRNGFTVNDGPLRRFEDPENASFLESIRKSECPKELEPEDRRSPVHVNLIRREENCPEPVKPQTPFQGVGRTLGGGTSSGPVSEPAAAAATTAVSSPSVARPLVADDSLPTTSIQLRLADGSRVVARFNTHHTVGDIRAYIENHTSSRQGGAAYTLQTVGFPPKQLIDATQTIEQAGLANSVVIQKL